MLEQKNMREKGSHFMMIKESDYLKTMTVLTIYAPNSRVSKYIKQNILEYLGEIGKSTIIFRDLNTPFSITDRTNFHLEMQNTHK